MPPPMEWPTRSNSPSSRASAASITARANASHDGVNPGAAIVSPMPEMVHNEVMGWPSLQRALGLRWKVKVRLSAEMDHRFATHGSYSSDRPFMAISVSYMEPKTSAENELLSRK